MQRTMPLFTFILLLANHACASDFDTQRARNWHQWRGPNANGVAATSNPPLNWNEDQNVKWKVKLRGTGSSTPIIWKDRVYLLAAVETATAQEASPPAAVTPRGRGGRRRGPPANDYEFVVQSFDRASGEQVWERIATTETPHEGRHLTANYAPGSPITDGQHLYAMFGSRGIYCYTLTGDLKWSRDLGDLQIRNSFGEGASPALAGDTLIVPWDHEGQSFVIALDKKTGETRWKVDRDEGTTWATPLVVHAADRMQVILHGINRVRSYDVKDGRLVWECGGQTFNPVASPVAVDGLVYCMTGRRGFAVYAIPLSAQGDITDTDKIAWHRTDSGPYVPSPVVYKGRIYHHKICNAILSSLDAKTGEAIFGPVRLPGLAQIYASPVAAADRIYITDREGTTLVIEHGPDLKVLATNKLDQGSDASLAIVENEIFLRSREHLYCIAEK